MGDWSDKAEAAALIILGLAAVGTAAIVITGGAPSSTPTVSTASAPAPTVSSSATSGDVPKSLQRLTELLRPGGSTLSSTAGSSGGKDSGAGSSKAEAKGVGAASRGTSQSGATPSRSTVAAAARPPAMTSGPTTVTATAAAHTVVAKSATPITGALSPRPQTPRTVTLERKNPQGHWVYADRSVTKQGTFAFTVRNGNIGSYQYRVVAPAAGKFTEGVSAPLTVTVAQGEGSGFALNTPAVRWNRCDDIGYVVNLNGVQDKALDDVKAAAAKVSKASGLKLVYRGRTDLLPGSNSTHATEALPPGVHIVVAWASPGTSSHLPEGGGSIGQTRLIWDRTAIASQGTTWNLLKQATITLDKDMVLPLGFAAPPHDGTPGTWGHVLMHHFGHAVGLAHPSTTATGAQAPIMRETLSPRAAEWAPSDLLGLAAVGSSAACLKHQVPAGSPIKSDGSLLSTLGITITH